jgi:calcium binding protein 39
LLDTFRHDQEASRSFHDAARLKASDDVARRLDAIQAFFEDVTNGVAELSMADEVRDLLTALLSADVLTRLISNLEVLDFEAKKAVTNAFSLCMQFQKPDGWPAKQVIEHVTRHPRLLQIVTRGCLEPKSVLHCSMVLKACIRHSTVIEVFLREGLLLQIIGGAESSSFEVASEVFSILAEILLDNGKVSSPYINEHFEEFFGLYNTLLRKNDYVTVRQSLKLLGDLLFEPEFKEVMIRYIGKSEFLQLHMNLLRDRSKTIQFEAFNVFKIFVANPRKNPKVHQILYQNRDKLVKFLEKFLSTTRAEDEIFLEDRQSVIQKLSTLDVPGCS